MTSRAFDIGSFLNGIRLIKSEFHITRVKRGNDRSRRRISLLVIDEFLRSGGDIHQAFFLEANLYTNLKNHHFTCNPTPEEVRIRELPRRKKQKVRCFDPLKLVSDNSEPERKNPYPLTKR